MAEKRKLVVKVGDTFGHLIVRQKVRQNPKDIPMLREKYRVECLPCGTRLTVPKHYLMRKENPKTHCGCQRPTSLQSENKNEYHIWYMINYRCTNKNHEAYEHYGARGIKVCEEWSWDNPKGFENFLRDMGKRPSKLLSVDRIDNDKGYSKENCRWATATEQRANQRPR